MLFSKLREQRRILALRRIYDWGNYDVTAGECRPILEESTAECTKDKFGCPLKVKKPFETPSFKRDKYPLYLKEIYDRKDRPVDPGCPQRLIRHDKLRYKPSDKFRKFQRTWPECPQIWLRPKDTCCPDPEIIPPTKRRVRLPPKPSPTTIEKHNFQMDLFCKSFIKGAGCKQGRRPPDCRRPREVSDCTKTPAPIPSFSEVCRDLVPSYCPAECACLTLPTRCDGLAKYQRCRMVQKTCTKPLIAYKPRLRFPY
ncbi:uncharacterized protein cola [Drosophila kikkawai]|uniref:Uncharacterized protein cola n=1 Tax=Drosophila kikkawai TaxID=30033 RepID=A0A6P4I2P4_DROKI|nr:uncharacterized protein LOC108070848 [Drosophila kikkawai]